LATTAELSPRDVLKQVAEAIPEDLRGGVIVVGSLAAAYWLFGDQKRSVRTKDVDAVLSPRETAAVVGPQIANRLLGTGAPP